MASLLAAIIILWSGQASCYAPGVFEEVWQYRQTHLAPCSDCVGYAAVEDVALLGRKIWVTDGVNFTGPLHVIDVGLFQTAGRIVELDAATCAIWHMRKPRSIMIQFEPWLRQYARDWVPIRMRAESE